MDLVVESRGPDTIGQSLIACALYGRIVLLITSSQNSPGVTLCGDVYGRSLATILRIFVGNRTNLEAMIRAISVHQLRPAIDRVFNFEQAHDAYSHFLRGDIFGKVVIRGC